MRYAYLVLALVVVGTVSIFGFRGSIATKPPLEVFPDMDRQAKYKPQAASPFFADGRADRPLPAGVVSRGDLRADDHLHTGKAANGDWAAGFPASMSIDATLMERGQNRYAIYCLPCHGAIGDGNGVTKSYGMGTTPSYHDPKYRTMPEGQIFNTITHGTANQNMLPYADKLSPEDRWAVVAYVRALQRAQTGTINDVPASHKSELGIQ
jgi:mono/diheme cytochrome c family protein